MMQTYTVRVSREGKWWMVYVPELDGLTQARRLSEVEDMARSLIAMMLDVPADTVRTRVELEQIEDVCVTEQLEQMQADKHDAEQAQDRFRQRQRQLARDLAEKGITVRDVGHLLGVSFQRAQQLLDDAHSLKRSA